MYIRVYVLTRLINFKYMCNLGMTILYKTLCNYMYTMYMHVSKSLQFLIFFLSVNSSSVSPTVSVSQILLLFSHLSPSIFLITSSISISSYAFRGTFSWMQEVVFFVIEGGSMNILYQEIEFKRGRPVIMN